MSKRLYLVLAIVLSVFNIKAVYSQAINDHMFAASAAAKPFIDFDSKGILVNGKRTFIVSAGLEYARVPRELWYDRLLRIKRAGFNCVEIYTIWNFHEAQEGKFDFTGDHNLGAFLDLTNKLGLYAIVRVGPYYCAEWDSGGYPIWLKFKTGLRVREHNAPFEKYVDRFFDHLLPIVFNRQINRGGPVIMVQLENEHNNGWGTVIPDGYFKHLQTKALHMGLQVPYFFSGLHHATDPAINGNFNDPKRPNPWFSTEFWSVWYSQYGAKAGDDSLYDRRTWKIIANGGNGYNYYMAHGGTNFGYTNNDEDAASYDYGAAIGQAGDIRPVYHVFKRAAWFARSFQDVLENSTNDSITYRNLVADTTVKITARKSPDGDIVFIDNPGKKALPVRLQGMDGTLLLNPGEIYPLVHHFNITPFVMLNWAYTRIFAIVKQDNTTTLIADAEPGSPLSLQFSTKGNVTAVTQSSLLKINGNQVNLTGLAPVSNKPSAYSFRTGNHTIRILVMSRSQTDHTWIADYKGQTYIVSGAAYTGDVVVMGKNISITTEQPLTAQTTADTWLYTDKEAVLLNKNNSAGTQQPAGLALSKWEYKTGAGAADKNAATNNWLKSKFPLQMGADGDITADAWYRTNLHISKTGKYTLQAKGGGRARAYIDGNPAATWQLSAGEITLNIKKGKHTLAVFTAHDGRDKLAAYVGPINNVDRKGIYGAVYLKKGGPYLSNVNNWYYSKASNRDALKNGAPRFDTVSFKKYKIGADAFNLKQGFGWFTTLIPKLATGTSKVTLSFKSVDENATVFVNGQQVKRHEGWNIPFEITISDTAVLKRPIRITLFIENYSNEGGIDQPISLNTIGNAATVSGWAMQGGPGKLNQTIGWQKLSAQSRIATGPCFYRSAFITNLVAGQTLIWRVDPKNLGHGSIWVNGHNLGRYPEKIAVTGLYIPECWLNKGGNQLVIYDEDGKQPTAVRVIAEPAAGRVKHILSSEIK
ncbi:beta-galactosidase [Mucilaginibacter glaciei]|uniref:Beta-galactosidase n=1 Tax=Mucilaginibacter glaciei TaxID=2772109 RepID=A0A926NTL0_9SPHI|nr:beta-galactosidase [Mucilaginibacter glaciei]MBD1394357.1 beta-galactosidase [Mucilaginibacter glaciei]